MCNCQYHVDHRRWARLLGKAPISIGDKRFVESYFERKYHEEADADYDAAVLAGTWPTAVEQLRYALRRAIKIRRERQNEKVRG